MWTPGPGGKPPIRTNRLSKGKNPTLLHIAIRLESESWFWVRVELPFGPQADRLARPGGRRSRGPPAARLQIRSAYRSLGDPALGPNLRLLGGRRPACLRLAAGGTPAPRPATSPSADRPRQFGDATRNHEGAGCGNPDHAPGLNVRPEDPSPDGRISPRQDALSEPGTGGPDRIPGRGPSAIRFRPVGSPRTATDGPSRRRPPAGRRRTRNRTPGDLWSSGGPG